MSSMKSMFYNLVLKRTSTFCLAMVASAMYFERTYDHVCEYIFEKANEGKLWMHIKDKYEETPNQVHDVALTSKTSLRRIARDRTQTGKDSKDFSSPDKEDAGEDGKSK